MLIVAGLALSAAATWYSCRAQRAVTEMSAALTAVAQKRATLAAELERARERGTATETRRTELQAALNELRNAKPVATATPAAPSAAPKAAAPNPRDLLLRDPKLQTLWLNSLHGNIARNYALFFATAGVTPAQVQRLEAAMIKRDEQLMDLSGAAQTQGQDSQAAIATLQQQARADYEAAIRDVLGDEGVRQLQEYDQSASARVFVGGMAGMAVLEDVPLTPAQTERLTKIITTPPPQGAGDRSGRNDQANWDAADSQVREFLTPKQFEVFQRARVEPQLMGAINRALQNERDATPAKASGVGG